MTQQEVLGTGIDGVEIARMARAIERGGDRFLRKSFSEGEIDRQRGPAERYYAILFAIKEAVLKTLGQGLFSLSMPAIDVELKRGRASIRGMEEILVSYAFDHHRVVALAIRNKKAPQRGA